MDPIHQFEIKNLFTLRHYGGHEIAFTNSAAYMVLAVVLTAALMLGGTAGRRLVPNRVQSMAELSYEFLAEMLRSPAGDRGMKFFPLVFTIFMFVFVSNIVGIIPYTFTVASHI